MKAEFEINDLGKFSYFRDLEFVKVKEGTITYQQKYIVGFLAKNSISHWKDEQTYRDQIPPHEWNAQDFTLSNKFTKALKIL